MQHHDHTDELTDELDRHVHVDERASVPSVDVDGDPARRRTDPHESPPGVGTTLPPSIIRDTRSQSSTPPEALTSPPVPPSRGSESGTFCPPNDRANLGKNRLRPSDYLAALTGQAEPAFITPNSDHPKQRTRKMSTERVQRSGGDPSAPLPQFKKPGPRTGADLRRPPPPGENRKPDRRSKAEIAAWRAQQEIDNLALLPTPDQIPEVPDRVDPAELWRVIREAYRDDPAGFVREVFIENGSRFEPQTWQDELLEQVASGEPRISVVSGHNVGKTTTASWIVLHRLITHYPQKTIVTSPVASQLESSLLPELKKWFFRLPEPLQSLFEVKAASIELKAAPYNSFIKARTASKDAPEAMQGIHCEDGSVLLVVDEASGVPDAVFQAAEGSMAGPSTCTLLISNPTRLSGFFFQTQHAWADSAAKPIDTAWRTLHISSLDPRCTLENADFARGVSDKYGIESNEYRLRVLGLFPDSESNVLIAPDLIDSALIRDIAINPADPLIYGVDVGRLGNDRTVLVKRRGGVVVDVQSWAKKDTAQSAALIWAQVQQDTQAGNPPDEVNIDTIGFGSGTADTLRALGCKVVRDVNVSESPAVGSVCQKLRDELWWQVREWLASRTVRLFQHDDLIQDLRMPTYSYSTGAQKVVILSKDLMRRVIGRSPDYGDALCMTFAGSGALLSGRTTVGSWKGTLRRNLKGFV